MRFAVLADTHANLTALDAVLGGKGGVIGTQYRTFTASESGEALARFDGAYCAQRVLVSSGDWGQMYVKAFVRCITTGEYLLGGDSWGSCPTIYSGTWYAPSYRVWMDGFNRYMDLSEEVVDGYRYTTGWRVYVRAESGSSEVNQATLNFGDAGC